MALSSDVLYFVDLMLWFALYGGVLESVHGPILICYAFASDAQKVIDEILTDVRAESARVSVFLYFSCDRPEFFTIAESVLFKGVDVISLPLPNFGLANHSSLVSQPQLAQPTL